MSDGGVRRRAGGAASPPGAAPRVGFVSLGCPKATRDSELILTRLRAEGYRIVPSYGEADLVVVNTCGFIDPAVEESLEAIGEALAANGRVVVTGCLGARSEVVLRAHPEVLAVTGPNALEEVIAAVHAHLPPAHVPFEHLVPPLGVRLTPPHYAYLKISEGCSHRCTFCIIPSLRGDLQSRPFPEVMREAETLVAAGVKELLVIAQDTGAYGADVRHRRETWGGKAVRTRIRDLAEALGGLGAWVRLHYVYPHPHVDELVTLMAAGRVLPYLDVPLQHANRRVLRAMRRPANTENALARIQAWRAECPELTVRSTFVVGFPGETEAEFEELLAFLRAAELDRVGCFAYSPVEGAVANALPGAVPEPVREERRRRLMELQAGISAERLARRVGQTLTVLVDQVDGKGAVARSAADAPEVDGQVYVPAADGMRPGEFHSVRVVAAGEHDLWAEPAVSDARGSGGDGEGARGA